MGAKTKLKIIEVSQKSGTDINTQFMSNLDDALMDQDADDQKFEQDKRGKDLRNKIILLLLAGLGTAGSLVALFFEKLIGKM